MELIRTLTQLVNNLRSLGIRRRVAVVCPNDPHTEYVIIRSLREPNICWLPMKLMLKSLITCVLPLPILSVFI